MLICIIGKSGSGKSTIAVRLERDFGIPEIRSHTTREMRQNESGNEYIFSDKQMFDKHMEENLVFEWTTFGKNYYWTIHDDYEGKSRACIVVDVVGAKRLRWEFADVYIIYIDTSLDMRAKRLGSDNMNRLKRDVNMFNVFPCDYIINGNGTTNRVLDHLQEVIWDIERRERRWSIKG